MGDEGHYHMQKTIHTADAGAVVVCTVPPFDRFDASTSFCCIKTSAFFRKTQVSYFSENMIDGPKFKEKTPFTPARIRPSPNLTSCRKALFRL